MTRFLHALSGALIWMMFLITGGALVYANGFCVEEGALGYFFLQNIRFEAMDFGGVMVLLALLRVATLERKRPKTRFISFESDEGTVSINVNAVRDFVRKIGDEFGAVVSLEPRLRMEKELLSIHLDVKIQTGSRIPELSRLLQNRVRESIRDGLGISEIREIKVHIQEITGVPPPSRERRV